jgi:hypothetical protein
MSQEDADMPDMTRTQSELHRAAVDFLNEVDPEAVRRVDDDDDRLADALATGPVLPPEPEQLLGQEDGHEQSGEGEENDEENGEDDDGDDDDDDEPAREGDDVATQPEKDPPAAQQSGTKKAGGEKQLASASKKASIALGAPPQFDMPTGSLTASTHPPTTSFPIASVAVSSMMASGNVLLRRFDSSRLAAEEDDDDYEHEQLQKQFLVLKNSALMQKRVDKVRMSHARLPHTC